MSWLSANSLLLIVLLLRSDMHLIHGHGSHGIGR